MVDTASGEQFDPTIIPLFKKLQFIGSLSEDDFRDRVVRPLFGRLNFSGGNDLCGPQEEGKDAVFVVTDPLGTLKIYVVQTKKGNLNLASKEPVAQFRD